MNISKCKILTLNTEYNISVRHQKFEIFKTLQNKMWIPSKNYFIAYTLKIYHMEIINIHMHMRKYKLIKIYIFLYIGCRKSVLTKSEELFYSWRQAIFIMESKVAFHYE